MILNLSAYALHGHLSASCRNLGGVSQNFALPRATRLSQSPFFLDKLLISHKTVYGNIVPEKESHVNSFPLTLMSNQWHHPGESQASLASKSGHFSVVQTSSDPGNLGHYLLKKSVHSPTFRHHVPRHSYLILK